MCSQLEVTEMLEFSEKHCCTEVVVCMHGNGVLNLSSNGRPTYNDGPGPEPIPLNSELWCFFLFPLIIFIMSYMYTITSRLLYLLQII